MDKQRYFDKALSEMLEPAPRKSRWPADVAPPAHAFNKNLDQVGFPLEHEAFIKKSCRTCNGKGFMTILLGDGYYFESVDGYQVKKRYEKARHVITCNCVHKRYSKFRIKYEALVASDVATGTPLDKAQADAKWELLGNE